MKRSAYEHVYFHHTNDLDAVLAYPHYSCPVFREAQGGKVIFGADVAGARGEYEDRLRQWEPEKAEAASEQCDAEGMKQSTARRSERWLSLYYGRPVRLLGIIAGYQPFDGYPWYFYRFEFKEA